MERFQNCIILDTVANNLGNALWERTIRGTTILQKLFAIVLVGFFSRSPYLWNAVLCCAVLLMITKHHACVAHLRQEFKHARSLSMIQHIKSSSSLVRISALGEWIEKAVGRGSISADLLRDRNCYALSGLHIYALILSLGVMAFGLRSVLFTSLFGLAFQTGPVLRSQLMLLHVSIESFCILAAFLSNKLFLLQKNPPHTETNRVEWLAPNDLAWIITFLENQRWWLSIGWAQEMMRSDPPAWSDPSGHFPVLPDIYLPLEHISESRESWNVGTTIVGLGLVLLT